MTSSPKRRRLGAGVAVATLFAALALAAPAAALAPDFIFTPVPPEPPPPPAMPPPVKPKPNGYLNGPNVENITIQNQCPADPVGHIGISYDWPAQQNVLNELGANVPNFQPVCSGYGIGV